MNPNIKGNIRKPFLQLKWKIHERAKIKDAFYSVRSIKEILIKQRDIYDQILKEERDHTPDRMRIDRLTGELNLIKWLFQE